MSADGADTISTQSMVEKVAAAMQAKRGRLAAIHGDLYRESMASGNGSAWAGLARAALTALLEPTGEMVKAALDAADEDTHLGRAEARGCIIAAIQAALAEGERG